MKVDGFGTIDVAISGMRAHGRNMELISANVANAQTTDNGKGQPYRRVEAKIEAEGDGISTVKVDDEALDMSSFPKIFKPNRPDADENGYLTMPNVDLPVEMMNLNAAVRNYQANLAVLKRYQKMVESTLELLR